MSTKRPATAIKGFSSTFALADMISVEFLQEISLLALFQSIISEMQFFTFQKMSLIHGLFYSVTGFWPILHMASFELITGPKVDDWVVKTIGGVLGITGFVLLGARKSHFNRELVKIAVGQSLCLLAADLVYVSLGRISPIYLGDALAEIALIIGWGFAVKNHKREL